MLGLMVVIALCGVIAAFIAGRTYERKQFVKTGTPKSDVQKVLGVFKK